MPRAHVAFERLHVACTRTPGANRPTANFVYFIECRMYTFDLQLYMFIFALYIFSLQFKSILCIATHYFQSSSAIDLQVIFRHLLCTTVMMQFSQLKKTNNYSRKMFHTSFLASYPVQRPCYYRLYRAHVREAAVCGQVSD